MTPLLKNPLRQGTFVDKIPSINKSLISKVTKFFI